MLGFLKVFGRGVLVTLALPLIALVWVLYGVYCIGLFIFMFVKSVIDFFRGKDFNGELIEDLEAKRIVLEKEKADQQAKDMLNIMYQNTIAQQQFDHPEPEINPNQTPNETRPYGSDVFNEVESEPSKEDETFNEEVEDDLRGN